jgi:hypothetical protein
MDPDDSVRISRKAEAPQPHSSPPDYIRLSVDQNAELSLQGLTARNSIR